MAEPKSFLLRIDPGLWAGLEGWARYDLRPVNGQIGFLLKQAVQKRRGVWRQEPAGARTGPQCAAQPVIRFQSEGEKVKRKILTIVMAATAAFSLVSLTAQEKKMDAKKAPMVTKGGILHPEMAVEHGTYDNPMASLGSKPEPPWTTTS